MVHEEHGDSSVPHGLYDHLVTQALSDSFEQLGDPRLYELSAVDAEDSHAVIAQYLEHLICSAFSTLRGGQAAERQRRLVDKVIATLHAELGDDWEARLKLFNPLRRLLAVHSQPRDNQAPRPHTPLARSALLTGSRHDPTLASELSKEFAASDRVDILCSFIRWSGIRMLLDGLRELTAKGSYQDGPRLRIISTSYMGATDPKAIQELAALPNTEVQVSYDTARTRLHAKAYLVYRDTGFGSAYIGSANISRAALSEGLEWTSKVSQYELPQIWQKVTATFESYWNDDEFETYDEAGAERLRGAIERERQVGKIEVGSLPTFDLRPYPFQEEILDAISAEREVRQKNKHLIVAATGTGKTMIAAFDYKAWRGDQLPSLLFIAHREEILTQALGTYRVILRDQNFGDILAGGSEPDQKKHLFCSIQSYNSRMLYELDPEHYDYVVVDEFHHAAAESYKRLLDHVRPKVLLGLTATPERTDGLDVLSWFDGEATAEVRLPDAIDRRLLCPFQYFGIADSENLDGLAWQRGGYRVQDLNNVYTGNDVRAGLVLDKVCDKLLDPLAARGLGFCVSVEHAKFMAKYFNDHGIPSAALSAESTREERRSVKDRLVSRDINFIFVVDLYNEGVDIPELDTVLFLRPTESLTVYLQQLGRGLRLHDDKDCLTVLDFIGAQHRQFRFASRFRALSTDPARKLDDEVQSGFPHLPAGCFIQLERVAQQRVLDNIKQSLSLRRPQLIQDLATLGRYLGRTPSIAESLEFLDAPLDDLLKRGLWSRLLGDAGLADVPAMDDEEQLAKGIRRLAHIDDPRQLAFLLAHLKGEKVSDDLSDRRLAMMHVSLWGATGREMSVQEANSRLAENPAAQSDLCAILDYRLKHTRTRPRELNPTLTGALALHASYTRDEALIALEHWDLDRRPDFREGVLHIPSRQIDAFFVTLQKTEDAYSPTTMYEDYAISDQLFHWQSQSTTSAQSPTGQRYIRHREAGYTPLLFVREHKRGTSGLASPYAFLGPANYVSHEGSRPVSIIWKLRTPMPVRITRVAAS